MSKDLIYIITARHHDGQLMYLHIGGEGYPCWSSSFSSARIYNDELEVLKGFQKDVPNSGQIELKNTATISKVIINQLNPSEIEQVKSDAMKIAQAQAIKKLDHYERKALGIT